MPHIIITDLGKRRIAHLGGSRQFYVCNKRRLGYEAALRDHGQAARPEYIITGGFHEEDDRSLREPPDAVFAINDPLALGAFSYCQVHGITVPDDITLVGFSNNPSTTWVRARLTAVSQPPFEIDKTAASLLLRKRAGKKIYSVKTIVLKTELVNRESA